MPYTYVNGRLTETETELNSDPTILAPFLILSTAPENLAETAETIAHIASDVLNIELAHSLDEIIENTYLAKAFYLNAPDVAPHTDGFIQHENCSIPDYFADLLRFADEPAGVPLCLILQHGAGDTISLCIPCLN